MMLFDYFYIVISVQYACRLFHKVDKQIYSERHICAVENRNFFRAFLHKRQIVFGKPCCCRNKRNFTLYGIFQKRFKHRRVRKIDYNVYIFFAVFISFVYTTNSVRLIIYVQSADKVHALRLHDGICENLTHFAVYSVNCCFYHIYHSLFKSERKLLFISILFRILS